MDFDRIYNLFSNPPSSKKPFALKCEWLFYVLTTCLTHRALPICKEISNLK